MALVSVLADELLLRQSIDDSNRDGLLSLDRITSVIHILILVGIVIFRAINDYISSLQITLAIICGLLSLFIFHRRMYFTFVEQDWKSARLHARLWHVAGSVCPLFAFLPKF